MWMDDDTTRCMMVFESEWLWAHTRLTEGGKRETAHQTALVTDNNMRKKYMDVCMCAVRSLYA